MLPFYLCFSETNDGLFARAGTYGGGKQSDQSSAGESGGPHPPATGTPTLYLHFSVNKILFVIKGTYLEQSVIISGNLRSSLNFLGYI